VYPSLGRISAELNQVIHGTETTTFIRVNPRHRHRIDYNALVAKTVLPWITTVAAAEAVTHRQRRQQQQQRRHRVEEQVHQDQARRVANGLEEQEQRA